MVENVSQGCARLTLLSASVLLQLASSVTPWDILLSLIAAATHDLDHPGVNQPFLIKTNHYLATLYKVSPVSLGINLVFVVAVYFFSMCLRSQLKRETGGPLDFTR